MSDELPVAVIRTSDRNAFKRCRRRWAWSSHLKANLTASFQPDYFWFGTGGHFAMEDYHGYNHYGHPAEAFLAYTQACKLAGIPLPDNIKELTTLGVGMLSYYVEWLQQRDPLTTFVVDGVPQCEVNVQIQLPFDPVNHFGPASNYSSVNYSATIDKVVIDEEGRLWVLDYKFNKAFRDAHYDTDDQVTAYCWIIQALYPGYEIGGMIYQQHKKAFPDEPGLLQSGTYTTAKNRLGGTTHRIYRRCLENLYGNINNAPSANIEALSWLAMQESEHRDPFIKRDFITRNEFQLAAQGEKVLMEVEDMLNPNLPLYPNATKDCGWDCSFHDVCVAMDRNDDWEAMLEDTTVNRKEMSDKWRQHLP